MHYVMSYLAGLLLCCSLVAFAFVGFWPGLVLLLVSLWLAGAAVRRQAEQRRIRQAQLFLADIAEAKPEAPRRCKRTRRIVGPDGLIGEETVEWDE
jgi:hypothetical protein